MIFINRLFLLLLLFITPFTHNQQVVADQFELNKLNSEQLHANQDKQIHWKVQSNKAKHSLQYKLQLALAREVLSKSKGKLRLEILPPNGFVGINESFNATRMEIVDGMFMAPQYWGASDPVFTILGDLAAAWEHPQQFQRWLIEENGIGYLKSAYKKKGMRLLGYMVTPMESLVSNKSIGSVKDLKGQVIRVSRGMSADLFKSLGAIPRNLPVNKIKAALQRGRISAADYSNIVENWDAKLHEYTKYTNYPGFHSIGILDFVGNEKRWLELSDNHQKIILNAVQKWQIRATKIIHGRLDYVVNKLNAQGIVIQKWSDEDVRFAREKAQIIWDRCAAKSPTATLLIKEIKFWLHRIGNI